MALALSPLTWLEWQCEAESPRRSSRCCEPERSRRPDGRGRSGQTAPCHALAGPAPNPPPRAWAWSGTAARGGLPQKSDQTMERGEERERNRDRKRETGSEKNWRVQHLSVMDAEKPLDITPPRSAVLHHGTHLFWEWEQFIPNHAHFMNPPFLFMRDVCLWLLWTNNEYV